ncbi:MAG: 2-keto-3-deoxygluconate permease [Clostridiaceae bacterium]|nr:2-keto-3-deoxygluconate permease [Clostridiaceae bacterium]
MNEKNSAGKQLLLLFLGILMCCGGLFLFSRQVDVKVYEFGNMYGHWGLFSGKGIPGGMVVIPLIIGIVVWVIFPKSFAGKLITILGGLFIILGIISSVNLVFRKTTLYEFILMIVLIFGGGALALRILFMPDVNVEKDKKKNKIDEINDRFN